jgi:hypothetical protein
VIASTIIVRSKRGFFIINLNSQKSEARSQKNRSQKPRRGDISLARDASPGADPDRELSLEEAKESFALTGLGSVWPDNPGACASG